MLFEIYNCFTWINNYLLGIELMILGIIPIVKIKLYH